MLNHRRYQHARPGSQACQGAMFPFKYLEIKSIAESQLRKQPRAQDGQDAVRDKARVQVDYGEGTRVWRVKL
jgi:hypothetical protein